MTLGRRADAPDDDAMGTSTAVEFSASQLLTVVADPVRLRLLSALAAGTRSLWELQPVAAVPAPSLSRHLKALRKAGLVTAARRGRWIEYSLAPDAKDRLRAALPAGICTGDAAADRDAAERRAIGRWLREWAGRPANDPPVPWIDTATYLNRRR